MESNKYQLTLEGLEELKSELDKLKNTERERNLEALKEARAQGDLSENADYDAAREDQARIEGRIKEIENILKNYSLIKSNVRGKNIQIGRKVQLRINDDAPVDYTIVGSLEANPFKNRISNESPIGKAIIGSKEGDTKIVKTHANKEVKVIIEKVY
jgi:transcription elongation factor GreA